MRLFRIGDDHIINMDHVTYVRVDGDVVIFNMVGGEILEFSQSKTGHRIFDELRGICDRGNVRRAHDNWPSLEQFKQAQSSCRGRIE